MTPLVGIKVFWVLKKHDKLFKSVAELVVYLGPILDEKLIKNRSKIVHKCVQVNQKVACPRLLPFLALTVAFSLTRGPQKAPPK